MGNNDACGDLFFREWNELAVNPRAVGSSNNGSDGSHRKLNDHDSDSSMAM